MTIIEAPDSEIDDLILIINGRILAGRNYAEQILIGSRSDRLLYCMIRERFADLKDLLLKSGWKLEHNLHPYPDGDDWYDLESVRKCDKN